MQVVDWLDLARLESSSKRVSVPRGVLGLKVTYSRLLRLVVAELKCGEGDESLGKPAAWYILRSTPE